MASLSRGFGLLKCQPPFSIRPIRTQLPIFHQRFFTTTLRCPAAAASPKAAKPTSKTIPKLSPAAGIPSSRYAFVKNLATKPTPTILYECPSNFWFYFGCWSSGISIIAWTALTGPGAVFQPGDLPDWVSWANGAAYILLGAMGFFLISKTPNIVSSIRVLPVQGVARAGASAPTLQMEITVQRMMPVIAPKMITTSVDNIHLNSRFSLPEEYVPELKRKRVEEEKAKALRKFDMEHIFTMPFRRMGRAFRGLFEGVRSAWTDTGFGVMKVDGKEYKVNVTKGFAHDGFRTLERVVPIKET